MRYSVRHYVHFNPHQLLSRHTGANVGKIVGKAPKLLLQSPEKIAEDADLVSAARAVHVQQRAAAGSGCLLPVWRCTCVGPRPAPRARGCWPPRVCSDTANGLPPSIDRTLSCAHTEMHSYP